MQVRCSRWNAVAILGPIILSCIICLSYFSFEFIINLLDLRFDPLCARRFFWLWCLRWSVGYLTGSVLVVSGGGSGGEQPTTRWQCPVCHKLLSTRSNLKIHVADKHSSLQHAFPCPVCGNVYKTRNSLHNHLSIRHRGVRMPKHPGVPVHPLSHHRMSSRATAPPVPPSQQVILSLPQGTVSPTGLSRRGAVSPQRLLEVQQQQRLPIPRGSPSQRIQSPIPSLSRLSSSSHPSRPLRHSSPMPHPFHLQQQHESSSSSYRSGDYHHQQQMHRRLSPPSSYMRSISPLSGLQSSFSSSHTYQRSMSSPRSYPGPSTGGSSQLHRSTPGSPQSSYQRTASSAIEYFRSSGSQQPPYERTGSPPTQQQRYVSRGETSPPPQDYPQRSGSPQPYHGSGAPSASHVYQISTEGAASSSSTQPPSGAYSSTSRTSPSSHPPTALIHPRADLHDPRQLPSSP